MTIDREKYVNLEDVKIALHNTDSLGKAAWDIISLPYIIPPKWIPVSERLPEKDGLYLVTYMVWKPVMDFSLFKMKKWHGLVRGEWTDYWYPVMAWMPLPEPYKEDE